MHNFMSLYAMNNMMLPGQVERWVTICNINQFSLKEMPVAMFKGAAQELGCNYIDRSSKQFVVNLTWVQSMVARMLQSFLDVETQKK